MKKRLLIVSSVLLLMASPLAAQTTATSKETKPATAPAPNAARGNDFWAQWVKTLTNVEIELTLTDQIGTQPPEKKTVSMIAASGNFGKVRSGSQVMVPGEVPYSVVLNVDARPFVSVDGPIQLELTLVYEPVKTADPKQTISENIRQRPSGINQSQTIILQSGKPLIVSRAADPVSDRKVVVEVKATVLK